MLLSLPSRTSNTLDTPSTYSLAGDPGHQKSMRRRSFWRSGHSQLLASLRRKRSNAPSIDDTASLSTSTSTCVSSASSFIQPSDTESTTSEPQSTPPANHPPAHVFGKGDQGYSMFYLKLPNGNWMVRCRTADRKIIATYEVDGSMV
ncbi:hypothetical protein [Absidia glauca]|uniref:Uncharacterized protein n=1 Tax=Absidia glauca TaxID=4829 RepID=A0A168SQA0_ABSGL|nr:hypothetical protein [Absidia glauca]